jgi:hypothetical protein
MSRQRKPDSSNSKWAMRRQDPDFIAKKERIASDRQENNQASRERERRLKIARSYYVGKKKSIQNLGIDNYKVLKQFIADKRRELGFDELRIPRKKTAYFLQWEIDTTFEDLLSDIEDSMHKIKNKMLYYLQLKQKK